ncbi:MAG TPA: molybdenum cofactor guanylyltransferase [Terriglobales bacterium]|jgi:molybdopterin-guanine dinucleotide biosynthesis protein A|nr:molybdenum cofactor guanylyltransferase [Terriglobales bacterium]
MSDSKYDQQVKNATGVTAFILAGGKSSRMGSDKAFLHLGDETLLAHALKLAGAVTEEVKIVGDATKFSPFGRVVEDVYRNRGPLGGIHAALSASSIDLNLMLAVDLPFVDADFLQYLLSRARESTAIVTLPRAAGGLQPLCAVYRRPFAEIAEEALRNGRNKIDSLFAKVGTCVIEDDELARAGFSSEMFHNLNTPDDLKKAQSSRHQGDAP